MIKLNYSALVHRIISRANFARAYGDPPPAALLYWQADKLRRR